MTSVHSALVAADTPPETSSQGYGNESFDWGGWYVGGGMGLVFGSSSWSATRGAARDAAPRGFLDLFDPIHFSDGTGSYFGELHAGYRQLMRTQVLVGVETASLFPTPVSGAMEF